MFVCGLASTSVAARWIEDLRAIRPTRTPRLMIATNGSGSLIIPGAGGPLSSIEFRPDELQIGNLFCLDRLVVPGRAGRSAAYTLTTTEQVHIASGATDRASTYLDYATLSRAPSHFTFGKDNRLCKITSYYTYAAKFRSSWQPNSKFNRVIPLMLISIMHVTAQISL